MDARLSGLVVGALIVGACGGGAPAHSIVPVPRDFERGSGTFELGAAEVRDAPRFSYRGMHLDAGRHFFGPEFVKRRRYPLLTQVSAYRAETIVEKNFDPYAGDGQRCGGFYTQEEIRDIVRYADRPRASGPEAPNDAIV
jgi:hexosaminidase